MKGKELVCQLTTQSRVLFLAADKEHVHQLLMFFLTTQIRLKDHLERRFTILYIFAHLFLSVCICLSLMETDFGLFFSLSL